MFKSQSRKGGLTLGIERVNKKKTYQLIVEDIKKSIDTGELKHGQQLPSIKKLAEDYQVSFTSVREAIIALEVEGIVVRRNSRYYEVKVNDKNSSF